MTNHEREKERDREKTEKEETEKKEVRVSSPKIGQQVLGAAFTRGINHFCPHSTGKSSFYIPYQTIGKNNSAVQPGGNDVALVLFPAWIALP